MCVFLPKLMYSLCIHISVHISMYELVGSVDP